MISGSVIVENLSVRYRQQVALGNVSFNAGPGEFVVIVGPSGSGKTSLLLALAGFITFEGRVSTPERMGVVLQEHAVYPWLTVEGNIGFGLRRLSVAERRRVIDEHLRLAGMEGFANRYPGQLSGGQRQRVAVARALATDPDGLLMDEPFSALDTFTRGSLQAWLLDVWSRRRKTVIFVTHDIEEAVFLADRIIVLSGGAIVDDIVIDFERPRSDALKFEESFQDVRRRIAERFRPVASSPPMTHLAATGLCLVAGGAP